MEPYPLPEIEPYGWDIEMNARTATSTMACVAPFLRCVVPGAGIWRDRNHRGTTAQPHLGPRRQGATRGVGATSCGSDSRHGMLGAAAAVRRRRARFMSLGDDVTNHITR